MALATTIKKKFEPVCTIMRKKCWEFWVLKKTAKTDEILNLLCISKRPLITDGHNSCKWTGPIVDFLL